MRRKLLVMMGAAAIATATLIAPAAATPNRADGDHKITICHVTNSATNPYVVIDIDVSAFDGEGANDHSHHVSKDGRVDVPYDATTGQCVIDPDDPGDNF